jgi:hypothetical protein
MKKEKLKRDSPKNYGPSSAVTVAEYYNGNTVSYQTVGIFRKDEARGSLQGQKRGRLHQIF